MEGWLMHYLARPTVHRRISWGTFDGTTATEFYSLVQSEELATLVNAKARNGRTARVELLCKGHSTGSAVYLERTDTGVKAIYQALVVPQEADTFEDAPAIERGRSEWESVTIRCFHCGKVQTRSAAYGIEAAAAAFRTTRRGKLTCSWMT